MKCDNLSRVELIEEIRRLENINSELRTNESKIWDMVKILITKISHEFKTPLNSIIGFTELLRYKSSDLKDSEYIKNISVSSEHMLALIQDILDVTRSQYKPLELSYSFFNTKDVIENIIKCFNNKEINYTLINYSIYADYTRFKQLVYNLISNAVKFNKANMPIDIFTYVEQNKFCFEIKDRGEGISEDNYSKIFDFFSQVSKDGFKRQLGSGIGLSLCKSIAESHKGKIEVKSEIGKGSTFIFRLPVEEDSEKC